MLILQRFCNEEGRATPNAAMVLKLRRLKQGDHSRSSLNSTSIRKKVGDADVGSTNLYYRGSYSGPERLCGSRTRCSVSTAGNQCIKYAAACRHVSASGDQCIEYAATCRHVPTSGDQCIEYAAACRHVSAAGDHAARTCRGA